MLRQGRRRAHAHRPGDGHGDRQARRRRRRQWGHPAAAEHGGAHSWLDERLGRQGDGVGPRASCHRKRGRRRGRCGQEPRRDSRPRSRGSGPRGAAPAPRRAPLCQAIAERCRHWRRRWDQLRAGLGRSLLGHAPDPAAPGDARSLGGSSDRDGGAQGRASTRAVGEDVHRRPCLLGPGQRRRAARGHYRRREGERGRRGCRLDTALVPGAQRERGATGWRHAASGGIAAVIALARRRGGQHSAAAIWAGPRGGIVGGLEICRSESMISYPSGIR
mmetsp:Transcript_15009/g.44038  ORF Transcript_15009/g.44038 Transcript_15009/m.44038 type:complete len:275 (+) Transcript_15009:1060-1884(+)